MAPLRWPLYNVNKILVVDETQDSVISVITDIRIPLKSFDALIVHI